MRRALRPAGWIRTSDVDAVTVSRAETDGEGAQGRLVTEPLALLCLKHTSITGSCCQQLSLTETELRGGWTGKQPLNAACVSSAITGLQWPRCPERCAALAAQMKGNGKLWLHYFKADCTEVSLLLAGRAPVLPSWPKTCAYLSLSFSLENWTEPNPLTGRNFHKFQLAEVFPLMLFSHEREFDCLILSPAGPISISFLETKIYDAVLLKN